MDIDIEGIIGFGSMVVGFFFALYKVLKMGTEVTDRIAKMAEYFSSGGRK